MSKTPPRRFVIAVAALALFPLLFAGCSDEGEAASSPPSSDRASYSFRDGGRPVYEKTIAAADLEAFREAGGIVLDVRLAEDFAADPATIPGSERRDPDKIAEWAGEYSGRPVALYCVKGKWVSQKAAAYLAARGLDTYSVEGGLAAWRLHTAAR
jgi:rhodanese-related sulfurtransferase